MMPNAAGVVRPVRRGDEAAIREIMERSQADGEQPGTTRHDIDSTLNGLAVEPGRVFVAAEDDRVVGFVGRMFGLVVVHPAARRRGHGTRLVDAALDDARQAGEHELSLASFGRAAPETFLARRGFVYAHSLWLLALPPNHDVPAPHAPPDVIFRQLRVDEHVGNYVALINASFVDHPTPLAVNEAQVHHVHTKPDFDPTTTAVVTPRDEPERLIGFCRTVLVHEADGRHGDVRLIGVLPAWRGRGLGRELLRWGVHRLREGGATKITLTVEARNARALGLYERHGFERMQEWPQWTKAIGDDR